jgi:hypothetical protein
MVLVLGIPFMGFGKIMESNGSNVNPGLINP